MADDITKQLNRSIEDIVQDNDLGSVDDNLQNALQQAPLGRINTAIGDSIYGINHRRKPGAIPINKDFYGLTFFTRPRLNLSTENIRSTRKLNPLLTLERNSWPRIIRCLLDPTLAAQGENIGSDLVDDQQAFISLLSNHLISVGGWPDTDVKTSTSPSGLYGEEFCLVDSVVDNYGAYDITANFRNLPGDPITLLFLIWLRYSSYVNEGKLVPYPDAIIQNETDYNTRIYRLVLDSTKTIVQSIGACGAAIPLSAPTGAKFNFESDRPINATNDQVSITFRCMGMLHYDDILVQEFNETTILFNDALRDGRRENYYTKVPIQALDLFNSRGYPRINPKTYELEWWVPTADYNALLPAITAKSQLILGS